MMKRFIVVLSFVSLNCVGPVPNAQGVTAHVVTFFENPAKGSSAEAFQASAAPAQLTSFSNLSPAFVNPGYVFVKWNTVSNGTGLSFQNGANFSFGSDLTLYAQWAPAYHVVGLCENSNSTDTRCTSETKNLPTPLTQFANLSPAFSNPGYSFSNWNTKANGLGIRYTNGQVYSFASDLTLYAQWVKSAAALNFVGAVPSGPSLPALNAVAAQILQKHYHQVEVVQFRRQDGAAVLGLLTKILVRHDGPGITVALQRSEADSFSTGVEVFAN